MPETLVQIGGDRDGPPPARREPRPEWLRIRLRTPERYQEVKRLVAGLSLNTVCTEARCPNIYECWGEHGTATFMILGDTCTRRCGFCSVHSGRPAPGVDAGEPERVAEAVGAMGLKHAVVTSVDRDDLPDGGAGHFRETIAAIHRRVPGCAVEVLTPDFRGVPDALDVVLGAGSEGSGDGPVGPEVFSHNVETVPRLYRTARPGSRYERSLELLAEAGRRRDEGRYRGRTKTAIMLGLGERDEEVLETIRDIREAGVEVLAMGQYLQPTREHLPVARYVSPAEFARFREHALALGFRHCEAGPLVRSSYHAHEHVPR
jgi:lipoic acid synthetase